MSGGDGYPNAESGVFTENHWDVAANVFMNGMYDSKKYKGLYGQPTFVGYFACSYMLFWNPTKNALHEADEGPAGRSHGDPVGRRMVVGSVEPRPVRVYVPRAVLVLVELDHVVDVDDLPGSGCDIERRADGSVRRGVGIGKRDQRVRVQPRLSFVERHGPRRSPGDVQVVLAV